MQTSSPSSALLRDAWSVMMQRDPDRANARNDIGWNGPDSQWAHRVSRYPFERWRDDMIDELVEKLAKYRAQLAAAGIDYDALREQWRAGAFYRSRSVGGGFEAARVPGRCADCGQPVNPGDMIKLERGERGWQRRHQRCVERPPLRSAPEPTTPFEVEVAPPPPPPPARPNPVARAVEAVVAERPAPVDLVRSGEPTGALLSRGVIGPDGTIARALANYEFRPQQLQMAELIERQIAKGRRPRFDEDPDGLTGVWAHVVAEMPTGTGKSFGYVVPGVLSGKRVIVSTAVKALQEQLLKKDLPFLQQHLGKPFTFAIIKGRSNYVCKHAHAQTEMEIGAGNAVFKRPEDAVAYDALNAWIGSETCEQHNGDIEHAPVQVPGTVRELVTVDSDNCLGKKCPVYQECYVERQKALVEAAQVVVANHALLLIDAKIKQQTDGFAGVLPSADVCVVDEAHRLEEVARNNLGEELTETRLGRSVRRLERLTTKHKAATGPDANDALAWAMHAGELLVPYADIFAAIRARLLDADTNQQVLGDERALIEPVARKIEDFVGRMKGRGHFDDDIGNAPSWLEGAEREQWGKVAGSFEKIAEALSTIANPDDPDKWCRYAEMSGGSGRLVLHCKPIDVSLELRQMIFKPYSTVVLTSATLAIGDDFTQVRERLGIAADADYGDLDVSVAELVTPSPFDYKRNSVLYVPNDLPDPRSRQRDEVERYFDRLATRVTELLTIGQCNTFCLFTSNTAMRAIHKRVAPRLPRHLRVFVQGDETRTRIVEAFKDETRLHSEPAVLFATRTFFEGVDLQGQLLEMVVIDKIPFPAAGDPLYRAFCDLIERRHGSGTSFGRVTLPEAVTTLKQATGRLIRTADDKGVCAILDMRVATKSYGLKIVQALPPMRRTQRLEDVRSFFAEMRGR